MKRTKLFKNVLLGLVSAVFVLGAPHAAADSHTLAKYPTNAAIEDVSETMLHFTVDEIDGSFKNDSAGIHLETLSSSAVSQTMFGETEPIVAPRQALWLPVSFLGVCCVVWIIYWLFRKRK